MPEKRIDADELVAELKERADRERASGRYAEADELAALALEVPGPDSPGGDLAHGFDLGSEATRVRFRPELGFSSKRVVGPVITGVKRVNLRLIHFVLDDLARQADAAVRRLDAALAAESAARETAVERQDNALRREIDARELLQAEIRALSERVAALEDGSRRRPQEPGD